VAVDRDRAADGGKVDAWGKSKLPDANGKLAGGGGDGGVGWFLDMDDVVRGAHKVGHCSWAGKVIDYNTDYPNDVNVVRRIAIEEENEDEGRYPEAARLEWPSDRQLGPKESHPRGCG
jgi:hypothetical protein